MKKSERILFAASEAVPFTPTGSLSEAVTGLLHAVSPRCQVALVLPLYSIVDVDAAGIVPAEIRFTIPVSDRDELAEVWKGVMPDSDIPVYFISSHYFERDGLYGNATGDYPDNSERFVFFSRAVLELMDYIGEFDIIHCHDWQTALVPLYLKEVYQRAARHLRTKTVFTIHNIAYQGKFWAYDLHILNLGWEVFSPEKLEFYNHINYLKGGVVYSDVLTTVSPTYLKEIQTPGFGFGLEGVVTRYTGKLRGILNGMDTAKWDPSCDPYLPVSYCASDMKGKAECRKVLCDVFNLPSRDTTPVFGMVSRFNTHKGIDILVRFLGKALDAVDARFVVLGTGDKILGDMLSALSQRHPDKLSVRTLFDEPLSHLVYGGSDFFLIPSRYEPCGITHMSAMRYGAVPIVHAVGGLADTVVDISTPDQATGILFNEYSSEALSDAVYKAVSIFRERPDFYSACAVSGMKKDFGWAGSADAYIRLYDEIGIGGKTG